MTYVLAEMAGVAEAPVYGILDMKSRIAALQAPDGRPLEVLSTTLPTDSNRYAMKWDGEWHITYEVFRDMGIAFAAVLVLIYVLVVGWFRSFVTPLIIMAPIPLTLIGILPAHALFGVFFTATSMIGFIALAGIIVRNSILLVDFINLELAAGEPLEEAVVKAGAVRFRPIVLTAARARRGRRRHPPRPDLPGPRRRAHLGRRRRDRPDPRRDPAPLLHVRPGRRGLRRDPDARGDSRCPSTNSRARTAVSDPCIGFLDLAFCGTMIAI